MLLLNEKSTPKQAGLLAFPEKAAAANQQLQDKRHPAVAVGRCHVLVGWLMGELTDHRGEVIAVVPIRKLA